MTPTDAYLQDIVTMLGVRVDIVAGLPADRDGDYCHETRVIRIRDGMHARHHRSVLAHELGHAVFGDVPSKFGPVNAKQERRAEEWAALRLITLDDYRAAEAHCGGHPGAMALELGVMRSIVVAFSKILARLGDTVYVHPRHGAGQWSHKLDVA